MFSQEFFESFRNTYFVEDLWTAGSETSVRWSLFNKVASLSARTHLTVLEAEAATEGVLKEKVFWEILQNSQETLALESLF